MALPKVHVRVVMGPDGKTPTYEVMHNGYKVCELSFIEVLELGAQCTSALRWYPRIEPQK